MHGVPACLPRALDALLTVVDEHDLAGLGRDQVAGDPVDRPIGLGHPHLVRVDDRVHESGEVVATLFLAPRPVG